MCRTVVAQTYVRLTQFDADRWGVTARCLDPNDLAISKVVAERQKDRIVTRALAQRAMTSCAKLLELLVVTPIAGDLADNLRPTIVADFAATNVPRS
jgi:hypothetical protein